MSATPRSYTNLPFPEFRWVEEANILLSHIGGLPEIFPPTVGL